MTITNYSASRVLSATRLTVTSDLAGTVFYHWYLDGEYLGRTISNFRDFHIPAGAQVRIDVADTTDPGFNGLGAAPEPYPARRTLFWIRSTDSDVASYLIEQQKDGGAWSTVGTQHHYPNVWSYSFLTARLDDLATYAWRVTPLDAAGNQGTAITLRSEKTVRTPDAPNFTATFDAGTTKVTFAAVA